MLAVLVRAVTDIGDKVVYPFGKSRGPGGAAQELPPGVKAVLLGDRDETKTARGALHCTVKNPLKEPFTLPTGTTEFTWVIEINPDWWGKAKPF